MLNKKFLKKTIDYEKHIQNFRLSMNLENLIPIIYKLKLKYLDLDDLRSHNNLGEF